MSSSTDAPYVPGLSGGRSRATYRGDVAEAVMAQTAPFGPDIECCGHFHGRVCQICGCTRHGALYSPVSAVYDPTADVTRVQFQPIPPRRRLAGQPLAEELPEMSRQQRRQLERARTPKHARKKGSR